MGKSNCLVLETVEFRFKTKTSQGFLADWVLIFAKDKVSVGGNGNVYNYRILDKSLKPCETHARRIVDFAAGASDMPLQNVRGDDKPCLEVLE